jgi:Peptidase A4 family
MSEQNVPTWKNDTNRSSGTWAAAVAVMAVIGFGFAGAVSIGAAVASSVSSHGASPTIPASLESQLHSKGFVTKTTSDNWGGYALTAKTNGTITEAFGEWFVPTIQCARNAPSLEDAWVGIDGYSDGTVEQAGTYAYCPSNGVGPYYWDWFEFFPYETIVTMNAVSAGDLINAYVLYNPDAGIDGNFGIYTLVVNDLDNINASFAVVGNPSTCNSSGCEGGVDNSAECISESLANQGYNLPNYKTLEFYSCDATVNGHWAGIGGIPTSDGVAHVYAITTYGYTSDKEQQTVSILKTYDYKDDNFIITWKRLN